MSGSAPLRRLLIHPDAYWAWDSPSTDAADDDDEGSEEGSEEGRQEEASDAESDGAGSPGWGWGTRNRSKLFHAAGLATLPAQLLRQYGLAVRTLATTRSKYLALHGCSPLSELLTHASQLPGRYDLEYEFDSLLEITRADGS